MLPIRFAVSIRPSFCFSACISSAPAGRSFVKIYIREFYENVSRESKLSYHQTRTSGNLHDDINRITALGTVWNVLRPHKNAERAFCWVAMAPLNSSILFTSTYVCVCVCIHTHNIYIYIYIYIYIHTCYTHKI